MDETWGPWIEHDGKGCPCRGAFAHVVFARAIRGTASMASRGQSLTPTDWVGVVNPVGDDGSWDWSLRYVPIIRYRIRKPRALLDLIERARELDDAPEGPRVIKHKETAK